ncbi:MAG: hypothetical protein AB1502_03045 [Thermodesulfobacteriota bacterium]
MTEKIGWLPPLVLFEDHGGDWDQYLNALYKFFKEDFVDSPPTLKGMKVALKRHPIEKGKEATFWHLISEGKSEKDRLPDLRRCERIRWPRPIIEHEDEPTIKFWVNERRGEKRICLWLEEEEYVVILAKRHGYVVLWTAYLVTKTHTKLKLKKEYEAYKKLKPPF